MPWLASSFVVAWFGAQFTNVAHFAEVSHVVCAAHGDVIHGDGHGHDHAHSAGETKQITESAHAAHSHETCTPLAVTNNTVPLPAPVVLTRIAEALPHQHDMPTVSEGVAVLPTLALAPKTSPPVLPHSFLNELVKKS